MKKVFFTLGLACLPLSGFADASCDFFSGFYVGAGLGFNTLGNKQQLYFDPTKVANVSLYNLNNQYSKTSFIGAGYLGYGYRFNDWGYVALEGIINSGSSTLKKNVVNASFSMKQENAYGGRIKLGYAEEPWLVYGLAGLLHANINRNVDFVNGGIYNTGTMFLQNINAKVNPTIYQLGAGLDYAFTRNWAVRFEYAHNFIDSKTYGVNHTMITYNNPKGTYHSALNGNQLLAGLRYRWGV